MSLHGGHFVFLVSQSILKAFVSCIYPKGMVAVTVLLDSSEDNLSAPLAAQWASHLKEKAGLCFCMLLLAI